MGLAAKAKIFVLALGIALGATVSAPVEAGPKPVVVVPDYMPIHDKFWKDVNEFIATGNPQEVLKIEAPVGTPTSQLDEWKLAIARALFALGQPIHAQYLLSKMASVSVGTRQGTEALRMLHEIAKAGIIDEVQLEELAFELDTKLDNPETRAMVGYFQARLLLRKGKADWATQSLGEVVPQTTWDHELEYDRTLQTLASGDAAGSYGHFEGLMNNPKARKHTATLSRLAVARLLFERKDFPAAIQTYREIDIPPRERARAFNELAWGYYYQREYGRALGTIEALKSNYFRMIISPETYLLEMLIYRELCQYQQVKDLTEDYNKIFEDVYNAIEARKPLDNIAQFVQMILQEGMMQKRATTISQIRQERRQIAAQGWASTDVRNDILNQAEKREKMTDADIQRTIRIRIEPVANWFLDLRDQVYYLEYEASMKMIQLERVFADDYKPPQRERLKFDTLFWPVRTEAWLDELLDYQVLVQGTCRNPGTMRRAPSAGSDDGDLDLE